MNIYICTKQLCGTITEITQQIKVRLSISKNGPTWHLQFTAFTISVVFITFFTVKFFVCYGR